MSDENKSPVAEGIRVGAAQDVALAAAQTGPENNVRPAVAAVQAQVNARRAENVNYVKAKNEARHGTAEAEARQGTTVAAAADVRHEIAGYCR